MPLPDLRVYSYSGNDGDYMLDSTPSISIKIDHTVPTLRAPLITSNPSTTMSSMNHLGNMARPALNLLSWRP